MRIHVRTLSKKNKYPVLHVFYVYMLIKSQKIAFIIWAWIMAVLAVLIVFQMINLEYFLVLSLIGVFIIAELSGPFKTKPHWKSKLNIALIIGMVLFTMVVLEKAFFWYSLITR